MSLTDEEKAQLKLKMQRGRAHKVSPELLAKEYLAGKSVRQIAKETGLHRQTVYGHLQRLRDKE